MATFMEEIATSAPLVSAVSSPTGQISDWLDAVLMELTLNQGRQVSDDSLGRSLRNTPLEIVISAIDRAGSTISARAMVYLYRQWIEANQSSPPTLCAAAWFNMGVLLSRVGDNASAAAAYQHALVLRPDLYAAANNLGLLYEALDNCNQALITWQNALQADEARICLMIQQGRLLEKLGRLDAAEQALRRVLYIDQEQPEVVHHWMHIRQKTCQWPVPPNDMPGLDAARLRDGCGPFATLALTDDIDEQRAAAAAWISRKTEPPVRQVAPSRPYRHERIRIGYISSDFCRHAMSYLITELFERHDRRRFEVYGYCASREDGSRLRQRVLSAFDHHRFCQGARGSRSGAAHPG
jgi:predicted O-linked N-acetylglucosamine transferase (SPINDLY family)